MVQVEYGRGTGVNRTAFAVEIPLMALALATVVLRVYSRLTIKRKLAADDVLIILGVVSYILYFFDLYRTGNARQD
jgi:hypothetical protein